MVVGALPYALFDAKLKVSARTGVVMRLRREASS